MTDHILVIGSGGREHALAWKLAESKSSKHIYVAPGNAGTSSSSEKISNCNVNIKSHAEIIEWCNVNNVNLVVVGPEDPLAKGLADDLIKAGIKCFGPCQKAAQIEASKEFAKLFMDRHKIPTARWKSFTNTKDAKDHILSATYDALVIKASGLAAGKGVIVGTSKEDAIRAVETLKQDKALQSASETIVIEELLKGEEISVLCFSDGTNISLMPPSQDHKRLLDNDEGPNTGGMGAYCRCPQVTDKQMEYIKENIMQKAIDGMKNDGSPYVGVLYAGLMMTADGPKVLEFNCRFGDPETQVIIPLLKTDLYSVMLACVEGTLNNENIQWATENYAVGVVVVSGGYPGSYPKGKIITGLDQLQCPDYLIFHAGTTMNGDDLVTSGGRVLAVVAVESDLAKAASKAQKGAQSVKFEGAFFRKDIAQKALQRTHHEGMTYKSAGVDIKSADDLVKKIKSLTKQTVRPEVCGGIGGFGGIFDVGVTAYEDPYLISRCSGINEKLKFAQECGKYELIGFDLVANCINEILCHGAEPLYFLDTYTCGKLDIDIASIVITGIANGCKQAECTLIGGETAEMPGMYADGDFDLAGFARGAVERSRLLPRKNEISSGDVVIGLISSTLNSYGFGIIRRLVKKLSLKYSDTAPFDNSSTLEEIVLSPVKLYVKSLLPIMKQGAIKAAAFINNGGLAENISRILPEAHKCVLDASKWTLPPIFSWIAKNSNLSEQEMLKNFNYGIDIILIIEKDLANDVLKQLKNRDERATCIGHVETCKKGERNLDVVNTNISHEKLLKKKNIGVLSSKNGTNLESLIHYTQNPNNLSAVEIAVVISDACGTEAVKKAEKAKIPAKVLDSKEFNNSADMDMACHEIFKDYNVDIICLDDFSRELSHNFIKMWEGKILNIHPSLLPAFQCSNVHEEVLALGARITGCTVFFVEPGKIGPIIEQVAVHVNTSDTVEILKEKVIELQYYLYPKAIELVARDKVIYKAESQPIRLIEPSSEGAFTHFQMLDLSELHTRILSHMENTARPGFTAIDSLCGIFDLKASGYQHPCLVSGTDGVGTKLKIAQACNKHDTIGIDLVAMCVNDILTHGAEPLFFLNGFDSGILNPHTLLSVISGIAEGCRQAKCCLIGSEISQISDIYLNSKKGIYDFGNYDVVGYAEGAVEKKNLLPRLDEIKDGDVVIGLTSSGIHSNGYSLVRKIVEIRNLRYQDLAPFDKTVTLGEALLAPTKIYVQSLLPLLKKGYIKGAAHITGGGLLENIPRILPSSCAVILDGNKWTVPPVLKWIAKEGKLSEREMLKTFNCGIGMVLIADKSHEQDILTSLKAHNETAASIGYVKMWQEGEKQVEVNNFAFSSEIAFKAKKRVGVLISGSGTNLQALIDYTQNPSNQSTAEIVLVISNVQGVEGLMRAEKANIPTKVLSHKAYKSRVEFDMAVHSILKDSGVEIVCLAGFMRILSKPFVELWQGKLLNVHPAILPAFKGMNAHKQVLELGARITGCTVHFVEPEVDAGAIIEQALVTVDVTDTEKTLQEKVKVLEHKIFPVALELLASGRISRSSDGKIVWHF